ncbi:MAG: right-handed parallel beta-helix repeat-containing protein [Kiritimatiellae bacterium]|nr:right-handed parallel beta-helix repeat-containing protein [Kiritimatiellia bacterium]
MKKSKRDISKDFTWLVPDTGDRLLRVARDGELPTLEAARDRIRALTPEQRAERPIRVLIDDGVHELTRPFVLGPADSGTPDAPIVYQAAPGARPRLSGGRRIANFSETIAGGRRVWVAPLPEVRTGAWWFTQLFVDGRRAVRARWPKHGFHELRDTSADRAACEAGFAPGELKDWEDLDDAELVALHFWLDSHLAVAAIDETASRVRFKHPAAMMLNDERRVRRCRYYIENLNAHLTEPGEWQLSARTGILTYLPLPGETLGVTTVIAPRLTTLVEICGTPSALAAATSYSDPGRHGAQDEFPPHRHGMRQFVERLSQAPVHDVHLAGVEGCYTEWHYPAGDPGPAQAAFSVPGAVKLSHCHDCSLRLNRLTHLGGYGVEIGQGAWQIAVAGNRLDDLGAGGIKLGHDSHFSRVCDNTITRGGRRFPSAIGIWVGHSGDNIILHNRIADFYYTGISVGWIWGYRPSRARRNRVECNHVTHIGQGMLSDLGGIYTLGVSPGTRVCSNVFRHVKYFAYGGSGLYPDEGSSFILYENNLVEDCDSGTVHMDYGRDCLFRNNVLIEGGDVQIAWGTPKHFRQMRLERNVIVFARGEAVQGNWFASPALVEFERNLWFRRDGAALSFCGHDWAQWRDLGFDVAGLNVDPLLADDHGCPPAWRADSPARALGFKPLDLSRVGPRAQVMETGDLPNDDRPSGPVAWAQLESLDPLPDTARYEDRFIHYPDTAPCTLRFQAIIENAGDKPYVGDVAIEIDCVAGGGSADTVAGQGARREHIRLKPGARVAIPVTVAVTEGVCEMVLRVTGDAHGFSGTVLGLGFRPSVRVPRVAAGIAAGDIGRALEAEGAPVLSVNYGRHRLGTLQIGLSGNDLAVFADVNDDPITLSQPPYKGSMIDLFGIRSAGKSLTGQVAEVFGQMFLIPGDGVAPARLTDTTVGAFAGGDLHFALRAGGYRLGARIPLSALKIELEDGEFSFKAAIYTHLPGISGTLRAHLFNERARSDPHAYGRMLVV